MTAAETSPATTRPGEPMLQIDDIALYYGKIAAVKGVSLRVHKGEIVTLIGSNGAGKTTTLRAVSGMIKPVSGTVTLGGQDITGLDSHQIAKRGLAHSPEGRRVFPTLSVLDNIRLGAFLRRDLSTREREAEVAAMLERFPGLRDRAQARAGLLSGGEQQMLAIARGLMANPRVLMLDEPSLGLAPAIIEELFAALDRLRRERVTILLVDQMAGLALALADRAYVIEGGRIVAAGSAAEIAQNNALERAYLGGE